MINSKTTKDFLDTLVFHSKSSAPGRALGELPEAQLWIYFVPRPLVPEIAITQLFKIARAK